MTVICPSNCWQVSEKMPAYVPAEPLDGREIECSNAVDHGLVECHAGRSPFFPLQLAVVEQVDDRR